MEMQQGDEHVNNAKFMEFLDSVAPLQEAMIEPGLKKKYAMSDDGHKAAVPDHAALQAPPKVDSNGFVAVAAAAPANVDNSADGSQPQIDAEAYATQMRVANTIAGSTVASAMGLFLSFVAKLANQREAAEKAAEKRKDDMNAKIAENERERSQSPPKGQHGQQQSQASDADAQSECGSVATSAYSESVVSGAPNTPMKGTPSMNVARFTPNSTDRKIKLGRFGVGEGGAPTVAAVKPNPPAARISTASNGSTGESTDACLEETDVDYYTTDGESLCAKSISPASTEHEQTPPNAAGCQTAPPNNAMYAKQQENSSCSGASSTTLDAASLRHSSSTSFVM